MNGAPLYPRCESCALAHLRRSLAAPRRGHDFEGPCGVRSFLLPVMGVAGPIGLIALRRGPEGRPRLARSPGTRYPRRDDVFRRAVRLLRTLAREPAWSANMDGQLAGAAPVDGVAAPGARVARAASASVPTVCETRSRRAVRTLIERVRREFTEPLELKQLAREFGLNASYLSTVFARETGMPFKSFLTAFRLERAQVLLCDPRLRITQVARAAGYTTPHRFRAVFRVWTGLPPGRWRAARRVVSER